MEQEKRNALINYRLQQSTDTLKDAELLMYSDRNRSAVNRIYYSVFYTLLALALKYQFETSKHLQLIGWFNKNFIHKRIIPIDLGKFIKRIFECRTSSDYDEFIEFEDEEVIDLFNKAKEFNSILANLINQ